MGTKTTYRTFREIEPFRRLYPDHFVPTDTASIGVTTGDSENQIDMTRPNATSPGLVSPEGVDTPTGAEGEEAAWCRSGFGSIPTTHDRPAS